MNKLKLLLLGVLFISSSYVLKKLIQGLKSYGIELNLPRNASEFHVISRKLKEIKQKEENYIALIFSFLYLYKQAFSIPGSTVLNFLAGSIFGVFKGYPMVLVLNTVGSTLSYLLGKYIVSEIVRKFYKIEDILKLDRENMFWGMLSVRLLPVSPNWLINLIAPQVNVPLIVFIPSVFLGLAPYNFMTVYTGSLISDVYTDMKLSYTHMAGLLTASLIATIPLFLKKRRNRNV